MQTEIATPAAEPNLLARLTARERSVLGLIITGNPVWATAGYLGLSRATVRQHLCNMSKVLGCSGLQQLFVLAIQAGLVERNPYGPGVRATFPFEIRRSRTPGGRPDHRSAA